VDVPEVRYARSGEVSIAFQVFGTGPPDLVVIPPWVSNVEHAWEHPDYARFYERLGSLARVIIFDKRGTGLSDRVRGVPTLEERMDDVRAVMDAVRTERAAVLGMSEGGPMSLLFAATYPGRVAGLIVYGARPRTAWAPDFPWGSTPERYRAYLETIERDWGSREGVERSLEVMAPSRRDDDAFKRWWATHLRLSASPAAARALAEMNWEIDVRHVLATIAVPTLVLNREGDTPEPARAIAGRIPGARYVELPGSDHIPFVGEVEPVLEAIRTFLAGGFSEPELDRVLATILFTDIVDSTAEALRLGDRAWRELLEQHHARVRRELARFRGREVDTAGDGFFASFDGPARGIRCACAVVSSVREVGLEVRAGLHTGECEVADGKLGGIAVHVGARIASKAGPGEVLVSSTVKDLVAGSGIEFADRGAAELKGLPGEWPLYAVASG
jgi:class 3 adenylate cyclase